MKQILRTYSELITIRNLKERFEYLKLDGNVGVETFGYDRYLNQAFYGLSRDWKMIRHKIITRDLGCELALKGFEIHGPIFVHHMNPVSVEDIVGGNPDILNPEYLVCVSSAMHNAIHYGDSSYVDSLKIVERRPNDMCPWRH